MNVVLSDLKHSIRTLLRVPGFTVTAVGTLALGIGATTAIFSIVNAVLLRRLAVTDPDRFVMLLTTEVSPAGEIIRADSDSSPLKFTLWREQSSVLQDVSAFFPGVMNYSGGGSVEQWRSTQVSADFFRIRVNNYGALLITALHSPEEPRGPAGSASVLRGVDSSSRSYQIAPRKWFLPKKRQRKGPHSGCKCTQPRPEQDLLQLCVQPGPPQRSVRRRTADCHPVQMHQPPPQC